MANDIPTFTHTCITHREKSKHQGRKSNTLRTQIASDATKQS